ncbi:hypothetical protein [Nocardia flavorosea]|uniref:Uncharacterized protein n=1 Tax=Nocardia flavorosea TaxID=53429 RepID=A0A846YH89_9NOCA|nr:hypothetical protein [Nocardia flavorosea]NKY57044.1 hypothetical protein [Nocardia flavorosea]
MGPRKVLRGPWVPVGVVLAAVSFGVAFLALLGLLLVTSGQLHYLVDAYPPLLAAAGVAASQWMAAGARQLRTLAVGLLVAVSAANAAVFSLPIRPVSALADTLWSV